MLWSGPGLVNIPKDCTNTTTSSLPPDCPEVADIKLGIDNYMIIQAGVAVSLFLLFLLYFPTASAKSSVGHWLSWILLSSPELTILTPNSDGGCPNTDQGQPNKPGSGEGDEHQQGDLHLVLEPVDGEAHDGGKGTLAQDGEQADHANLLVLDAKRPEVIHHHSQEGTKNSLMVKIFNQCWWW